MLDMYDIEPLPFSYGPQHPIRCRNLIHRIAMDRFVCPCEIHEIIGWYANKYNCEKWYLIRHAFKEKSDLKTGMIVSAWEDEGLKSRMTKKQRKEYWECIRNKICYRCKGKVDLDYSKKVLAGACFFCNEPACHYLGMKDSHSTCKEIAGWSMSKVGIPRLRGAYKIENHEDRRTFVAAKFLAYIAEQRRTKCLKNKKLR